MITRTTAIFVGIGTTLSLYNFFSVGWFLSSTIGVVAYLLTRYFFWFIAERAGPGNLHRTISGVSA